MDMPAIAAVQQSVGALFDLARAVTGAVVDEKLKSKLIDIQQGILDVQAQLGDAQWDRMELLREVQALRDKLRATENVRAKLDGYELYEVDAGKFFYRSRGSLVEHFACPRCFASNSIGVLQLSELHDIGSIRWKCSICAFEEYTDRDTSGLGVRVRIGSPGG